MNRLYRSNLLLAACAGVLALLLWWSHSVRDQLPALTSRSDATVMRLTLHRGDEPILDLERRADGWYFQPPGRGPANSVRVRQLLGILQTPSLRRFPLPIERAAEFGLADPEYRLQLDDLRIDFGGSDPLTHQRYVLVEGQVHLIGDGFRHHLLAGAAGFTTAQD